jgi:DNA-binding NtrC family response regulator
MVSRVAPTESSVIISGESGTGKEVLARTIHDLSDRRESAFLPVNCGAISPGVMESELFGHERGSFTGAERRHRGCFERASRGTLFLDEIAEMPAASQSKLLRVLETGRLTRVGGEEPISVDVRIVAATNRPLDEALASGALREDLYYRLRVFQLDIPPLRSRPQDIPLLARHFLAGEIDERHEPKRLSAEAVERLRDYTWPGNVRELRNAVVSASILAEEVIEVDMLPREVRTGEPPFTPNGDADVVKIPIGTSIREAERHLIEATLERCDGNKAAASDVLGVSLKTLYNRLHAYEAGAGPAADPGAADAPVTDGAP